MSASAVQPPAESRPSAVSARHAWTIVGAYAGLAALLSLAGPLPNVTQMLLTWLGGEGSREVHVGRVEWLFARSEISALHSRLSTDDAARTPPAVQFVIDTAAKLKEQGVPLLLVTVPGKATIYPEFIAARKFEAPLPHSRQAALHDQLRAAGIGLLDLTPEMWRLKVRKQVFFQQDSHWTPDAMKLMAESILKHVRSAHPRLLAQPAQTPMVDVRLLDRASHGALVEKLGVAWPDRIFSQEQVTLVSVIGLEPRPDAPIALAGGSPARVFDDPALGFATEEELAASRPLKAGIGSQLAVLFNQPLDITTDASSSLAAMRALIARPKDEIAKKKLVIWLLAAEELLSPSPPTARARDSR